MDLVSLRKKSIEDLTTLAQEKQDEIIEMRRKIYTDGVDDVSSISKMRKDIARILTVRREKELEEKENS